MATSDAVHFIDKISGELKEKLSSHGLLSNETWKKSLLPKLKLPEYIRQRLLPLHGLCTYEMLEDIRYGGTRVADWDGEEVPRDTEEWFSRLRETTSEWSTRPQDPDRVRCENLAREGMLSHQWGCMGEELLALDKATRVPRDAPQLQQILKAVRSVPEYISSTIFTNKESKIIDIGSFACDTKVLDCNEFDFLLIIDSKEYIKNVDFFRIINIELTKDEDDFIKKVDKRSFFKSEPHIYRLYCHGPAFCLEIGWTCTSKHFHSIGVDTTPSELILGKSLSSMLTQSSLDFIEKHLPDFSSEEYLPSVKGAISLSTFDRQIFTSITKEFPNAIAAFRIMKVVAHFLFPKLITYVTKYEETQAIISSHHLKLILFHTLAKMPSSELWSVGHLHERIAEMLNLLHADSSIDIYSTTDEGMQITKAYKPYTMTDVLRKKKICELYGILKKLINLFMKTYDNTHHLIAYQGFQNLNNIAFFVFVDGKYHPVSKALGSDVEAKLSFICKNHCMYFVREIDMLLKTHPIISLMQNYIYNKYKECQGITIDNNDDILYTMPFLKLAIHLKKSESLALTSKAIFIEMTLRNFKGDVSHSLAIIFSIYCEICYSIKVFVDKYSMEYRNPFLEISKCYSLLNTRERALVRECMYGCCLPGHQKGDEKINQLIKFGYTSDALKKLLCGVEYVEFVWIISSMEGHKDMQTNILTFTCISYMLKSDKDYFTSVTDDDIKWAKAVLGNIKICKKEGKKWRVIRSPPGEDSLYHCVLCLNCPTYRDADRLTTGEVKDLNQRMLEIYNIPVIKKAVLVRLERRHKCNSLFMPPLMRRKYMELLHSTVPHHHILSILSESCQRSIHLYEEKHEELTLVKEICAGNVAQGSATISLLQSIDSKGFKHYDLITLDQDDGFESYLFEEYMSDLV